MEMDKSRRRRTIAAFLATFKITEDYETTIENIKGMYGMGDD
jgi:hypothetical protein